MQERMHGVWHSSGFFCIWQNVNTLNINFWHLSDFFSIFGNPDYMPNKKDASPHVVLALIVMLLSYRRNTFLCWIAVVIFKEITLKPYEQIVFIIIYSQKKLKIIHSPINICFSQVNALIIIYDMLQGLLTISITMFSNLPVWCLYSTRRLFIVMIVIIYLLFINTILYRHYIKMDSIPRKPADDIRLSMGAVSRRTCLNLRSTWIFVLAPIILLALPIAVPTQVGRNY